MENSDQNDVTTEASEIEENVTETQMSEETEELELLRTRAKQMKLSFHPATGLEKLRKLVNARIEVTPKTRDADRMDAKALIRLRDERVRKDALKLVRVRVTCMNPSKAKHQGEVFTASNSVTGTVRKYIPFRGDPWHIPQIILNMMKERNFTQWYDVKNSKGQKVKKHRLVPEFAIAEVPAMTPKEMLTLKSEQALSRRLDDDHEVS